MYDTIRAGHFWTPLWNDGFLGWASMIGQQIIDKYKKIFADSQAILEKTTKDSKGGNMRPWKVKLIFKRYWMMRYVILQSV